MESLNSLLIIASAFSVFGQYIDNNHRSEYQAVKDKLFNLELYDLDHNEGMGDVKKRIDHFDAKNCLRAIRYIQVLFLYLISIVATIGLYHYVQYAKGDFTDAEAALYNYVITFSFSSTLFLISILLAWRLFSMNKEKNKAIDAVKQIIDTYDAVVLTVNSIKAYKTPTVVRVYPAPKTDE